MTLDMFIGLEPWRVIGAVTVTAAMVLAVIRQRRQDRRH